MTYTYDGCCGSCIYMNTNEYVRHKDHCYCTYRRQYYNLTDQKCSYYEYDRNKDYYDLNKRWHIVSAVLSILNMTAEDAGIGKLARFRLDVLEKDERYENALRTYDVIGPFLACMLVHDPDAVPCSEALLRSRFRPIEEMIGKGETEAAFLRYAETVSALAERYHGPLAAYCARKRITGTPLLMKAE